MTFDQTEIEKAKESLKLLKNRMGQNTLLENNMAKNFSSQLASEVNKVGYTSNTTKQNTLLNSRNFSKPFSNADNNQKPMKLENKEPFGNENYGRAFKPQDNYGKVFKPELNNKGYEPTNRVTNRGYQAQETGYDPYNKGYNTATVENDDYNKGYNRMNDGRNRGNDNMYENANRVFESRPTANRVTADTYGQATNMRNQPVYEQRSTRQQPEMTNKRRQVNEPVTRQVVNEEAFNDHEERPAVSGLGGGSGLFYNKHPGRRVR